jgi:glucose/arabinose dehydrogenase
LHVTRYAGNLLSVPKPLAVTAVLILLSGAVAWMLFGARERSVAAPAPEGSASIRLEMVASGFDSVTDIQFVPGGAGRAVVLEKGGTARLVDLSGSRARASTAPIVFQVNVRTWVELGLLGLAFHPRYRENGRFFINDNPAEGPSRTRVSEWRLAPAHLGKKRAQLERVILEVEQPFANHNAGQLAFGPDGMLYIGLGDGGAANDPHGHGQNLETLLGSMLSIEVDRKTGSLSYGIPADNPFAKRDGARGEIWAYGLRNPWRYGFDSKGRLIVADVGQDAWEELDIVARGDNLGWNVREGLHCFKPRSGCASAGLTPPVLEYGHDVGKSITGGFEYRGERVPSLAGKYVYADYESGRVWSVTLPRNPKARAKPELLGKWPVAISTFGRDERGELFAADFDSGTIFAVSPP